MISKVNATTIAQPKATAAEQSKSPATVAQVEQASEPVQHSKYEAAVKPSMTVAPSATRAPVPLQFVEIVSQNEPWLKEQEQLLRDALKKAGLTPAEAAILYDLDITGHEIQVCLACGQVGHDYMPTMVRQENPEINMLDESVVLFLELCTRVGIKHGMIAYDEGVLALKEIGGPLTGPARQELLERFSTFRRRNDKDVRQVNGSVLDWMSKEMSRWDPSWAHRKMAGDPADGLVLKVSEQLYGRAQNDQTLGVKGVVIVKGQPPKANLKLLERLGVNKGFKLRGIAVGSKAAEIAAQFLSQTDQARNMHQLKDSLVKMMVACIAESGADGPDVGRTG